MCTVWYCWLLPGSLAGNLSFFSHEPFPEWLGLFTLWPLGSKRKCSKREDIKITSLLRSRPGSRLSSLLLESIDRQGAHPDSRGYTDFISRWRKCQIICAYLNVTQCVRKPGALMDISSYLPTREEQAFRWTSLSGFQNCNSSTQSLQEWEDSGRLKQIATQSTCPGNVTMSRLLFIWDDTFTHLKSNSKWDIFCCYLYHFNSLQSYGRI